jgi:DNA invertase Pin-like site-specific DNA recombinase
MKIGYARVSTKDQNLDLQIDALKNAGCEKIFQEKLSAAKDRPELNSLMSQLRVGDTVVVWKLDRLGRSLKHLIDLMTIFKQEVVDFISLSDNIDTTTPQGRLIFNMFASFAEFERELIGERTRAGLEAVKLKRGSGGGRTRGLSKENLPKYAVAINLAEKGEMRSADIYKSLGLSKATYYRYLQMNKVT